MTVIEIKLRLNGGREETVTAPLDMDTSEFLDEVLSGLHIETAVNGHRPNWTLIDPATGQALQPKKTIRENNIHPGQELLLEDRPAGPESEMCPKCGTRKPAGERFCLNCGTPAGQEVIAADEPEDIAFFVHLEDGSTRRFEVPADLPTQELLVQIVGESSPGNWSLDDEDTHTGLSTAKTLSDNGVRNGHHLYLRKIAAIRPGPGDRTVKPKPSGILWKIAGAVAAVVVLGIAYVLLSHHSGSPSSAISIDPIHAEITLPDQQKFSATVGGKPGAITWSISPRIGTIRPDGLYTPPPSLSAPATVTVTASLEGDPAKTTSAQITLHPARLIVSVAPAGGSLKAAETLGFSATIAGATDNRVTWSIQPAIGSISPEGIYTAPLLIGDVQAVEVKATSVSDPGQSTTAHIALEPVTIVLRPRGAALAAASNLRIVATLTGTSNHAIRWSLSGPGAISKDGIYSAPSQITEPVNAQVTATSSADLTKSATLAIKVTPVVSVKITPATGVLVSGQRERFAATVSGTSKTAVRWTLTGPGTLSQDGEYLAPNSVSNEETVRIVAASEADPTKSAAASVTLRPISVSISPAVAELRASQSTRFIASSSAGSATPIRWILNGKGTLTQEGVYTAPALIAAEQTVRVIAVSTADTSRLATAVITLKRYTGPPSGVLIWSGPTDKNGAITIDGSLTNRGALRGELFPGVPISVKLDSKDFAVTTPPGASNAWKRVVLNCKKAKGASEVRILWTVDR